jgi:PAS domain S-box-containing protein
LNNSIGGNKQEKPTVPEEIKVRWQKIIDILAGVTTAQAALIMRLDQGNLEAFLSSKDSAPLFARGMKYDLNSGLFCEKVMRQRQVLLVEDGQNEPEWEKSPTVVQGMTYYLGFPLIWPEGEIFGTICIFDHQNNTQATQLKELVAELRGLIERDLQMIMDSCEREHLIAEISRHRRHLQELVESQTAEILHSKEQAEEFLRFEQFISELFARLVNLPSEEVDREITRSLNHICQFFNVGGCGLFVVFKEDRQVRVLNASFSSVPLPLVVEKSIAAACQLEYQKLLEKKDPLILREENISPVDSSMNGSPISLVLLPVHLDKSKSYLFVLWVENSSYEWMGAYTQRLRLVGKILVEAIKARDVHDALMKSEKGLVEAQLIANLGSWEWDIIEDKHQWSEGFYRVLGLSPRDGSASYERFLATVHPDDREAVDHANHECIADPGKRYSIEYRAICPDGAIHVILARGDVFIDENRRSARMIGTVQDITERKQAEEALAKSESNYRELVQNANSAILRWERNGIISFVNEYAQSLFGYSAEELIGVNVNIIIPQKDTEGNDLSVLFHNILDYPELYVNSINENVCRGGRRVWMSWTNKPIFDENGNVIEILAIGNNITELKQAKEELEKAFDEIKGFKQLLEAENIYLRDEIESKNGCWEIIGSSLPLKRTLSKAKQVARTHTTVLLTGETGTGKGMFARFIHQESDRRNKPFVNVNCAGLPANLIESELFGREKGAFTGSTARQIGRFELANNGTIFLDEIGELPLELQAKLLKVIEDGEFERLGSPHTVKVDVRIIASTNRNLEDEIKKGAFRQDLFYRLNVFPITVPPLRDRKDDIPFLVEAFIAKFNKNHKKTIQSISRKGVENLTNYHWPGNVRELINVIERAAIVSNGPELQLAEMLGPTASSIESPQVETPAGGMPAAKALSEIEHDHILTILQQTGWRIEGPKGAALLLQLHPNTLRARMKKLGIKRPGT